jgi:hypothetical protein
MTSPRKIAEELLEVASNQFHKNQTMQWTDFLPLIESALREYGASIWEEAASKMEDDTWRTHDTVGGLALSRAAQFRRKAKELREMKK